MFQLKTKHLFQKEVRNGNRLVSQIDSKRFKSLRDKARSVADFIIKERDVAYMFASDPIEDRILAISCEQAFFRNGYENVISIFLPAFGREDWGPLIEASLDSPMFLCGMNDRTVSTLKELVSFSQQKNMPCILSRLELGSTLCVPALKALDVECMEIENAGA